MVTPQKKPDDADNSFEIAKDIHSLFIKAMEERYKDILSFLGFVLPALTGFVWLAHQYEAEGAAKSEVTFYVGSIATLGVLLWGGLYSLATSYRYRYLQASVYRIEEAMGAARYIPRSFKPTPVAGFSKRVGMSVAPGILQIHVFFFFAAILGVGVAYFVISQDSTYRFTILACSALCGITLYVFGAFHYPRKLNALIQDLREGQDLHAATGQHCKVIFLTGPSAAGKSTLRDFFCQHYGSTAVSAVTTRPSRPEEHEVHRTIPRRTFRRMLAKGQLCLVAENHGHQYGYILSDIQSTRALPILIEVDSATAIASRTQFGATIVRVIPASIDKARQVICAKKTDGMENRLADLERQTAVKFLKKRRLAGDTIFRNGYDAESLHTFAELIHSLTQADIS